MSRLFDRKFALQIAKNEGAIVVRGNALRILLDLDEPEDEIFYDDMFPVICEHINLKEVKRWRSKNGGLHVEISSPRPLTIRTRLLIQACLGSDRVKEFLSLVRVWKKETDPVMLFKPKTKVAKNSSDFNFDDDVPF